MEQRQLQVGAHLEERDREVGEPAARAGEHARRPAARRAGAREHGERAPARERGAVGHLGDETVEAEPDAALDLADRDMSTNTGRCSTARPEVEHVLVVGEADQGTMVGSSRRSASRYHRYRDSAR